MSRNSHVIFFVVIIVLLGIAICARQAVDMKAAKQARQPGPVQRAWEGVPVLTSGPVAPTAPKSAAALDGSVMEAPMLLSPAGDFKGVKDVKASVTFPLGGKYQRVSFTLAQQALPGDLERFAYGTLLRIAADGKVLLEKEITKDSLFVTPQPYTFDIAGVNQVVINLETFGKKVKEEGSSYVSVKDQYGPFFPVLLGGLDFE